jgi:transcriptional regulator of acetoin/glycerol metabolism
MSKVPSRGLTAAARADSFFRRIQLKNDKKIMGISNESMELLMSYAWPGNVRELKSAFEYAFVTCQDLVIQPYHFPPTVNSAQRSVKNTKTPILNRTDMKKKQLIEALESAGGNQSRAAEILGISRVTVWNCMKRYGITARKKINR